MDAGENGIRVLSYHGVQDDQRTNFEHQILFLRNFGEFISIRRLVTMVSQGREIDRRYFCITFDDGDRTVLTNALPILTKYSIPSMAFIITDTLQRNANQRSSQSLSVEECRTLLESNVSIGSHSCSHANLATLSEEGSREQMTKSKRVLEDALGVACLHFACPFGVPRTDYLPEREPRLANEVGYQTFFTTTRGTIGCETSLYECPRDIIEPLWALYQLRFFFGN